MAIKQCLEEEISRSIAKYNLKVKEMVYSFVILIISLIIIIILSKYTINQVFVIRIVVALPLVVSLGYFVRKVNNFLFSIELVAYNTYKGKKSNIETIFRGFKPDISNLDKFLPIFIAIKKKQSELVIYYIKQGININIRCKNCFNITPLHVAYICSNNEMIEYLIKNGANVNALDDFNKKPIDYKK